MYYTVPGDDEDVDYYITVTSRGIRIRRFHPEDMECEIDTYPDVFWDWDMIEVATNKIKRTWSPAEREQ